jgi:hypothetical protein
MTKSSTRFGDKKNKRRVILVALATACVLMGASRSALAVNSPVTQLEYLSTTNTLIIQITNAGNFEYYKAQLTSPGCNIAATSIDTIKIWLSIAQASLLSGKNVTLYSTTCNSQNYLYDIVLAR